MSDKRAQRRLLSRFVGAIVGLLLMAGFVWFVHAMMGFKTSKQERLVQTDPGDPAAAAATAGSAAAAAAGKDRATAAEGRAGADTGSQPDQAPDQPLGVDAEGSAGGDAFGLAARRGGADLIGGTGSAPYAWYTNRMRDEIKDRLASSRLCTSRQRDRCPRGS